MLLAKEDQDRIAKAVQATEARTSGQIVCVLARSSSHNTSLPVTVAALAALLTPWLLTALTGMTVYRILTIQFLVFLAFIVLFCLPAVRTALIPRKAQRALAHRAAMEQFISRGLGRTADRSGVLIFVSLAERYARIVATDEIAQRVPKTEWQAAVDALTTHMRDGRVADGFIAAIDACGDKLTTHFPRTEASGNSVPDRIYLI